MGFHINPKIAAKKANNTAGKNTQSGNSKFIAKPTAAKAAGPAKKPVKTGGARGS